MLRVPLSMGADQPGCGTGGEGLVAWQTAFCPGTWLLLSRRTTGGGPSLGGLTA